MGEPRVPAPKPFVLKILVSKFFENKILRDTLSRNPRRARLSGVSKEKFDPDICSQKPIHPHVGSCVENLFYAEIHSLEAVDATVHPTGPRSRHSVADS